MSNIIIPFDHPEGVYILLILSEDSITRIKEQDPAEFCTPWLPPEYQGKPIQAFAVSYCPPEEWAGLEQLVAEGNSKAIIQFALRGWRYRPDHNDGAPIERIGPKTR